MSFIIFLQIMAGIMLLTGMILCAVNREQTRMPGVAFLFGAVTTLVWAILIVLLGR